MSNKLALEEQARQIVWDYLWVDTEVWALHEGIGNHDWKIRQEKLRRLDEVAGVLGEDRVRAIWADVRDEIRREMADMAREVVPHDVVADWLAGRMSARPAIPPEFVTYEWPDPPDAPPPSVAQVEFDPEEQVREGLGRVMRAKLFGEPL